MTNIKTFSKTRALAFTSLAHFANDGNFLLFSLLVVYFSKIPGINIAFLGVNAIIYNIIYGVLSLPIGRIADKLNKDSLLIFIGIFLEGLAASLFGFAFFSGSFYLVFIILGSISLGAGQAFYHPLGASILSFVYKKDKLGVALGINGGFGSTGRALLPSVITFFILIFGSFTGLEYLAVYTWVLAMIIYFGLRGFRRVYSKQKVVKKHLKLTKKLKLTLLRVSIPVFLKGAFLMGTVIFVAKYLDQITGSVTLTGIILTLSFIPAIAGQPFFGYLTSRKGGKYIISITSILSFFMFIIFLSFKNIVVITLSYAILAFLLFNGFSVLLDYTYQLVPKEHYSTAYSVVWGLGNILGGAFGIALMTFFLTFTNIFTSMFYMAFVLLASIIVLPLLPRERADKL
ncbi:MAG: major facilitator superfamily MFS_1 [Candidatus Parvarchaeum acidophilus ARMAN-5]|jgi:MFS family permease|uniref:Major facilitator superfamily MFS_1 n=1 Tax=Candidatus Parvarchaeum acidophilus ARMAN-5 TaxID=662762 RepID=D6GVS6_PARA5|nr:MAG: major facilitator superfamily MFS_1 [Candidatus Parvarchaeum acidophilus ARMAN-5]